MNKTLLLGWRAKRFKDKIRFLIQLIPFLPFSDFTLLTIFVSFLLVDVVFYYLVFHFDIWSYYCFMDNLVPFLKRIHMRAHYIDRRPFLAILLASIVQFNSVFYQHSQFIWISSFMINLLRWSDFSWKPFLWRNSYRNVLQMRVQVWYNCSFIQNGKKD